MDSLPVLERIDVQQQKINFMELTEAELDAVTRGPTSGLTIGALAGYIISMGKDSSRLAKSLVCGGAGFAGLVLGAAFGVQTVMERLVALDSPLGVELRILEKLRMQLRKRGANKQTFGGEEVDAERERLESLFKNRTKSTG